MPIRVAIADDEPLARRRLLRFLHAEADVDVVAECGDGPAAVAALRDVEIDLLFLDVQMPGLDGFEVVAAHVAAHGAARMPAVIFVTAYDEFAIRAFEVNALDYLLKPVTAERFGKAFARARAHQERQASTESRQRLMTLLAQVLNAEKGSAAPGDVAAALEAAVGAPAGGAPGAPAGAPTSRIVVRTDGRVFFVRAADVDWFEADGNYVKVHQGKQVHTIRETIGALEASLDRAQFARIHRSTIVNLDRIAELQPWFAGDWLVLLRDGTKLKLSRTYREQVQARLQALR